MNKKRTLSASMTETEFENGYWYAGELRTFAAEVGIPSASKLRKDELEKAIKHFIRTGESKTLTQRDLTKSGDRDVDKGLRLDLPVEHYTSNQETKEFIEREASKIEPGFRRASGTRYLLNRWREEQLAAGKPITYGDLVLRAIELNKTKDGPLRVGHARYINFVSDFLADRKGSSPEEARLAWEELKAMDVPKTYESWVKSGKDGAT